MTLPPSILRPPGNWNGPVPFFLSFSSEATTGLLLPSRLFHARVALGGRSHSRYRQRRVPSTHTQLIEWADGKHTRQTTAMFTIPPTTAGGSAADATALARQLGHTPETWQTAGHSYHVYSGRFEVNPYLHD